MTLDARNLGRTFGRTRAIDGVSVALAAGRVHALVGENGAGKSTLLKMLAGAERPDTGTMTLDGAPYAPSGLVEAAAAGVALVFQEITINPALGVAENIFIDRLRRFAGGGFLDSRAMERAAQGVLDRLGARIRVGSDIGRLDLGQWKCIEIARALSRDPKLLFLDESTAYLDHREVDAVLTAIRRLREEGLTIAFVSHHLAEVRAVADDLTILKDGRQVGRFTVDEIAPDEIHRRMVGRDISGGIYPARPAPAAQATGPVFRATGIALPAGVRNASLDVAAGKSSASPGSRVRAARHCWRPSPATARSPTARWNSPARPTARSNRPMAGGAASRTCRATARAKGSSSISACWTIW